MTIDPFSVLIGKSTKNLNYLGCRSDSGKFLPIKINSSSEFDTSKFQLKFREKKDLTESVLKEKMPEMYGLIHFFGFDSTFKIDAQFYGVAINTPLFAVGTFMTNKSGVYIILFKIEFFRVKPS